MTETFSIIPGSARILWFVVPLFAILVGVMVVLGASIVAARTARFEISPAGLRLRGDVYGRMIPAATLDPRGARAVDLSTEQSLKPAMRTNGTGLPGFRSGWFRLNDGQKALLYVTDQSRVAYVPTRDGYAVMMSVADPDAFVATLRRVVTAAAPQAK